MAGERSLGQQPLWNRYFVLIIAASLLAGIVQHLSITAVPLYAMALGANPSAAGLLMGTFTFSALVFRPVFGSWSDRRGRRFTILFGMSIVSLAAAFYGLLPWVASLFVFRFLHGLGFSAYSTASGTAVADVVPQERLTEGIGYFGLVNTAAIAVGPPVALALAGTIGYQGVFYVAAVLSVGAALVFSWVNYEKQGLVSAKEQRRQSETKIETLGDTPHEQTRGHEKKKWQNFVHPNSIPAALVVFFSALTVGGILTFLPAYGLWRGIEDIGMFFTLYATGLFVPRLLFGRLADRIGITPVLLPGLFVLFLSLVLLAGAETLPAMLVAGFFYGLGFGTVQPLMNAVIIKVVPAARRGTANAAYFAAMDMGIGLGSILWGFMSEAWGYPVMYLSSSLCAVVGFLVYWFVVRPQPAFRAAQGK